MKACISKGVTLGFIAGLITTILSSLFLLIPDTYVPLSYPLLLVTFNTLFWMLIGGLAGFLLWLAVGARGGFAERESYYWVLFFIIPFAFLYGLLGSTAFEKADQFSTGHALSLLWVSLFIVFLIFYCRKKRGTLKAYPLFFLPVIAVVSLLIFSANFYPSSNEGLLGIFSSLANSAFLKPIIFKYSGNYEGYLRLYTWLATGLYIILLVSTGSFCIRFFSKVRRFNMTAYRFIGLLVIIAGCFVAGLFTLNRYRFLKNNCPTMTAAVTNQSAQQTPVILIVLDTVRRDSLLPYRQKPLMKNLEQFSREALVYENCIANSSWTVPSHASLFTGLSPSEHGSHGDVSDAARNAGEPPCPPLPDHFLTLAEVFRNNGYLTAAVVSNAAALSPSFNLNQGFQIYDSTKSIGYIYELFPVKPASLNICYLANFKPKHIKYCRMAEEINSNVFCVLKKCASRPFFLFINYMDAHNPYLPPRPFDRDSSQPAFAHIKKIIKKTCYAFGRLSRRDWDSFQRSQYDGEIAYLDQQLGNLFARLKELKLYDSSLIIITSDHGELFGEKGLYYHRTLMYEGVIRVPLLIKFPLQQRAGRENGLITLADLYPTILSICKLPTPDGISGKAFGKGNEFIVAGFRCFEHGTHRALYHGNYKYMTYEKGKPAELYDLEKDPQESENIAAKMPEAALRMDKKLQEWMKQHPPKYLAAEVKQETVSPEALQGLKALGYIQ